MLALFAHADGHLSGDDAAHPIEPPSVTLAAWRALRAAAGAVARPLAKREPSTGRFSSGLALAIAHAIAAVRPCSPRRGGDAPAPRQARTVRRDGARDGSALPARPMTARSGASNCRT